MPDPSQSLISRRAASAARSGAELWATLGLSAVLGFFLLSGAIAYLNIRGLRDDNQKVIHSHTVLMALDGLMSTAQDAETGQRGYLLTGKESYLQPYDSAVAAIATRIDAVALLTRDNPTQQANLAQLERHLDAKLHELQETVLLRQERGAAAALAVVTTDRGKAAMDALRAQVDVMRQEELRLRELRLTEMARAFQTAVASGILSGLLGAVLTIAVFVLIRRNGAIRARQQWMQSGQVGLADAMLGDQSVNRLAGSILTFLAGYVGCQAAAVFKREDDHYYRAATLGVPADAEIPDRISLNEGLLGQVGAEGRSRVLHDVPSGYLTVGSALGQDKPRHLVIFPTRADDAVNAVIELGFFQPVEDRVLALLEETSAAIGIALRSARYRAQLQEILEETQRQAEELQVQSEELRVSNEELARLIHAGAENGLADVA